MSSEEEWKQRPCMEEWTIHHRPCPWFKAGQRCTRTWGDLVSPWHLVIIFASECNIMVAAAFIIDAVVRKNACGRDGKPYQRLVFVVMVGFVALGGASLDIQGGNRILSVGPRLSLQVSIRVLTELALFEVGDSYTHALGQLIDRPSPRIPNSMRVLFRGTFATVFSGGIALWELLSVPPSDRPACLLSAANTIRNVGTALIDLLFFLAVFGYALSAKNAIADRFARFPTEKLAADKRLVETLTTHIIALCACMGLVFSFGVLAAVRNSTSGKFLCEQPACAPASYPLRILWVFWYHIGVWVIVFSMVPNRIARRISAFFKSLVPEERFNRLRPSSNSSSNSRKSRASSTTLGEKKLAADEESPTSPSTTAAENKQPDPSSSGYAPQPDHKPDATAESNSGWSQFVEPESFFIERDPSPRPKPLTITAQNLRQECVLA